MSIRPWENVSRKRNKLLKPETEDVCSGPFIVPEGREEWKGRENASTSQI